MASVKFRAENSSPLPLARSSNSPAEEVCRGIAAETVLIASGWLPQSTRIPPLVVAMDAKIIGCRKETRHLCPPTQAT
jgi:hypothetical protein